MRQSREVAEETRRRIVRTAARRFRRRGIDGTGIADLMKDAGLTHGGFYKHFESKDALAGEACRVALAATRDELAAALATAPAGQRIEAVVDSYLSMLHRDHPGHGCAIAALGAEVARADGPARTAMIEGHERLVTLLAGLIEGRSLAQARRMALAAVSVMVGALTIARLMKDRDAAADVLGAARHAALVSLQPAT
jgi:TetR/AcrR family transcriptional repressor of nem operon